MLDILAKSANSIMMVLVVGLALGAGLPALYAIGMKALGFGRAVAPDGQHFEGAPTLVGKLTAGLCFALVICAALFGIVVIVAGNQIFGKH